MLSYTSLHPTRERKRLGRTSEASLWKRDIEKMGTRKTNNPNTREFRGGRTRVAVAWCCRLVYTPPAFIPCGPNPSVAVLGLRKECKLDEAIKMAPWSSHIGDLIGSESDSLPSTILSLGTHTEERPCEDMVRRQIATSSQ